MPNPIENGVISNKKKKPRNENKLFLGKQWFRYASGSRNNDQEKLSDYFQCYCTPFRPVVFQEPTLKTLDQVSFISHSIHFIPT